MDMLFYIILGLTILSLILLFLFKRLSKNFLYEIKLKEQDTARVELDKYNLTQLFLKALSRELGNELITRNKDRYYFNFKQLVKEWMRLKELNDTEKEQKLKIITDKYEMHNDFSREQDCFYSHEKYETIFNEYNEEKDLYDLYRNIRLYGCLLNDLGKYKYTDGTILEFGYAKVEGLFPDAAELEALEIFLKSE